MAKLKIYTVPLSDAFLPSYVRDSLGLPRHVVQAPYYVAATTKKAAIEHLDAAGIRPTPRSVRLAHGGNQELAMRDGGLLAVDGEIVSYGEYTEGPTYVVRVAPGTREDPVTRKAEVVGEWQYLDQLRGVRVHRRFYVRHADGGHFPQRADSQPPTPSTGWVPPEEDA